MSSKITALLIALFFGMTAMLNFIYPDRIFSEYENRYLQEWPVFNFSSLFSGRFGRDFDLYIQDQFPDRDAWIAIKTLSERLLGKQDNGRVYFGRDGYLLMIDPRIDQEKLEKNCAALHELLEQLAGQQKDLRSVLLLVPSASSVMQDLLPAYAPVSDFSSIISMVEDLLGQQAFLVDSLDVLKEAAESSRQLYYRTDHHWTTAGAFAVYLAWARAMGVEPQSRDDFSIVPVSEMFYGTCWSLAHILSCKPDTIESWQTQAQYDVSVAINGSEKPNGKLYNPAFLDKKDKYAYFLGGNYATVDIKTGIQNGRSLLLVKDSYANAFIPFLIQHYERILVVDPRYLNISLAECLEKFDGFTPTDFLLLCQASQFASDSSYTKLVDQDVS